MLRIGVLLASLLASSGVAQAERGWLGVYLADAARAEIAEVLPDSPAAAAGVRAGDVVVAFDRAAVASAEDLIIALAGTRPGQIVALGCERDGAPRRVEVRLGDAPDDSAPAARAERAEGGRGAPPAPGGAAPDADGYAAALARARVRGVPLLVVFHAEWCANSKALRAAFAEPEAAAALARVETVWIDAEADDRRADAFGVRSLPHLVLVGSDGEQIAERVGYLPPAAIADWLGTVVPIAGAPAAGPAPARSSDVGSLRREVRDLQRELDRLRAEVRELRAEVQRLRRAVR